MFFFFSSRRRHTRWTGDWSSDVCSSDLPVKVGLMSNPDRPMTIGAVAALSGRRPSSIRYYEQIGLLPPAARASGRRVYGPDRSEERRVGKEGRARWSPDA